MIHKFKSLFIFFFILIPHITIATDSIQQSINSAGNIASQVQNSWNTQEGFNNNIKAITTGKLPISTLDKSKQKNVSISCPGTQILFEILVQPGTTGDLNYISVAYDSDLDGSFDGHFEINGPVSGVCANGFVKCDPGTWENCRWYKWKFDADALSAVEVVPSKLGGCYCINTGCTHASFFDFKDQVLRSLGGGIASAMSQYNPRLSVAEAEIDNVIIRYYAQNAGNCSLNQGSLADFGLKFPEDLYENSALLASSAENEVIIQNSDPDSFYNLLINSPAYTKKSRISCTLQRTVYFDFHSCSIQESITNSCTALENDPDCTLEEEIVYDIDGNPVTTYSHFNPTGIILVDTCKFFDPSNFANCIANCIGDIVTDGGCHICYTGHIGNVQYLGNDLWKVSLQPNDSNSCGDIFDYQVCGKFEGSWNINDDPCVSVKLDGQDIVEPFCEHSDDSITSSSGNFSGNTGSLEKRLVVSLDNLGACNGWASGSLIVYMKLNGASESVCRDWWKIERTYLCSGSHSYNPDVSRAETIAQSLTEGKDSWTYTDPVTGTGSVNLSTQTGTNCIEACKLKINESRAQANSIATTADYRNDSTSVTYIYRTCIDGTCPVKEGETIIENCKCLNEFNEAIGVMESLRQASIDMICSDGNKK